MKTEYPHNLKFEIIKCTISFIVLTNRLSNEGSKKVKIIYGFEKSIDKEESVKHINFSKQITIVFICFLLTVYF